MFPAVLVTRNVDEVRWAQCALASLAAEAEGLEVEESRTREGLGGSQGTLYMAALL